MECYQQQIQNRQRPTTKWTLVKGEEEGESGPTRKELEMPTTFRTVWMAESNTQDSWASLSPSLSVCHSMQIYKPQNLLCYFKAINWMWLTFNKLNSAQNSFPTLVEFVCFWSGACAYEWALSMHCPAGIVIVACRCHFVCQFSSFVVAADVLTLIPLLFVCSLLLWMVNVHRPHPNTHTHAHKLSHRAQTKCFARQCKLIASSNHRKHLVSQTNPKKNDKIHNWRDGGSVGGW